MIMFFKLIQCVKLSAESLRNLKKRLHLEIKEIELSLLRN